MDARQLTIVENPAARSVDFEFFMDDDDGASPRLADLEWREGLVEIASFGLTFADAELTHGASAQGRLDGEPERERKIVQAAATVGWQEFLRRFPVLAIDRGGNAPELVDGWHRMKLARAAGETRVTVLVGFERITAPTASERCLLCGRPAPTEGHDLLVVSKAPLCAACREASERQEPATPRSKPTAEAPRSKPTTEAPRAEPRWGIEPPEGVVASWGARAIYAAPNGVDLLWDRQGFHGDARAIKRLARWLNTRGLRALRHHLRTGGEYLASDEHREVRLARGGYVIVANPRASHGYLYLGAWPDPAAPAPTPAPHKLTLSQRQVLTTIATGGEGTYSALRVRSRFAVTTMSRLARLGFIASRFGTPDAGGHQRELWSATDAGRAALATGGAK